MAANEVTVALSEEVHAAIRDAVADGRYTSEGDVIREALQVWRDTGRQDFSVSKARRVWSEGLASGEGRVLDIGVVKREGRLQLEGENGPKR